MSDGTVYLIHFERPFGHAKHYLGWAKCLQRRLAEHRAGNGARLIAVIMAAGIGWELARTWDGPPQLEARLKRQGGRSRHCPICSAHPRQLRRKT